MTHLLYIVNTIFTVICFSLTIIEECCLALCVCICVLCSVGRAEQISYNLSSFRCPVNLHVCVQMNTVTLELELNGQDHPVCLECHLFS